ncbi:hypothetical protein ACG7TL_006777 [Trametes sanguinea]
MPRLRSRTVVSAPRQPGGRFVEAGFAALTRPGNPPGPAEEHSAERTDASCIPTAYTHQEGHSRGPESDEPAALAADSHSAPHNSSEVTQAADVTRDSTPTREHAPGSYDENGHYVPAECYKEEYALARQRVRWASKWWGTREALSTHFAFHGFLEYEALQEELKRLEHKEEERRINPKPKRVRPPRDESIPSDLAETEAPSDYSSSDSDSFEWETTPSDEEEASMPLVAPAVGAKRAFLAPSLASLPNKKQRTDHSSADSGRAHGSNAAEPSGQSSCAPSQEHYDSQARNELDGGTTPSASKTRSDRPDRRLAPDSDQADLLDWSTQRSSLWTFPSSIASKAYKGPVARGQ